MSDAALAAPPGVPTQDAEAMFVASAITKRFGSAFALRGAGLTLKAGEVHGLLGANGAGKSTLSRIVAGHLRPDEGTLTLRGQPLSCRNPRAALDAGIALVTQETTLAPDLSVLENIFLPSLGGRERLSFAAMRREGGRILDALDPGALSLDAEVGRLSMAQRQLVEIAKSLALKAGLIIFDEPTASLSPAEVERLFGIVDTLRKDGRAIAFVSHRLEEVFAITDRVTVLREGRTVAASVATRSLDQAELIRLMVGQELSRVYAESPPPAKGDRPVALRVRHLRAAPAVRDVSFDLHKGEILGLAGLVGAGRSESVEAIIGLRKRDGGTMELHGKPFAPRKPSDAVRAGLMLVPEDRRKQSIIPHWSVHENLMLGHLAASRSLLCGYGRRKARAAELMRLLDLPAQRLADDSLLHFSGGMQQKIIIARWLMLDPSVLIFDEPTRGVDIATRASIYALLRKIADGGVSVLVISSDFEELLGVCERLVVVSDGATTADLDSASINEEMLTLLAAPRSSMPAMQALLDSLAAETGAACFWGLPKDDSVVCLARNAKGGPVDPAFAPGRVFARAALDQGESAVITVPIGTQRGHGNGFVGLSCPRDAARPDPAAIARRVAEALGTQPAHITASGDQI